MVLALAGCVYSQIGRRFDISKVSELRPGVSTEQDARRLFGDPLSVTTSPQNGHQLLVWEYVYGTALATGGGAKLAISFDASGRMLQIIQETDLSGAPKLAATPMRQASTMPPTPTVPAAPMPLARASAAQAPLRTVAVTPSPQPFIPCNEGGPCGGGQGITVNP